MSKFLLIPSYILITPARNEAQFIELTLKSMVLQTLRPLKWIIVNDGSTDGTEEIVTRYTRNHSWIELLRMPERKERHFAGKVDAFNIGYARAKELSPDIIGNIDADVSFEPDHFEYLLTRFAENPKLGVGGAPFREGRRKYDYRFSNIENVWGGCQLFRRECFEAIGGYLPLPKGSVDHIAVVTARMKGWETRTFVERVCNHHRPMGTGDQGALLAKFKLGAKDYRVGNHPLWQLFRTIYQVSSPPFLVGAMAMAAGYAWSLLRRERRPVSPDFIAFTRIEQRQRLRHFLRNVLSNRRGPLKQERLTSSALQREHEPAEPVESLCRNSEKRL